MTKMIQVSDTTYATLKTLGQYGDTMDDIVSRLITKKQKKQEAVV